MIMNTNQTILIVMAALSAGLISWLMIPVIIRFANNKGIIDLPDDDRKIHHTLIPTLGGVALFGGIVISFSAWIGHQPPNYYSYLIAALVIIFIVGLKDDIEDVSPYLKLLAQFVAAGIVVVGAGIRLHHFDGFLGMNDPTELNTILFTSFSIVVIINAYNLIDGVDGLAGSISLVSSIAFGIWFYLNGLFPEAMLAFVLAGALVGFLYHNFEPAKIFMGDTGALMVGFIMAVLAFKMISLNSGSFPFSLYRPSGIAFAIMIVPLYDTLRIILVRLYKRKSPFKPDNQHIHHMMLKMGFSHRQIALILSLMTVVVIVVAYQINRWEIHYFLIAILFLASLLLPILRLYRKVRPITGR
jgi:UDP-GlcNAc:undecaprenyl-phosphate/decaprenyl-phosphate GlcNAc-1-phosphate transferase